MRITDFPELVTATGNDLLVTVDIANDLTKKIKLENLPISIATTVALATKQNLLVSGTNIKTLNSVSLLGSGDIVLAANPSGVSGAIQFSNGSAFASDAANLFWDDTNKRLGVLTNAPSFPVDVAGEIRSRTQVSAGTTGTNGTFLLRRTTDGATIGSFSTSGNEILITEFSGSGGRLVTGFGTTALKWLGSSSQPRIGVGFNGSILATTHIQGSGSTSATTSLLVQNSAGSTALQVTDDQILKGYFGTQLRFQLGGSSAPGISTRNGALLVGYIDGGATNGLQLLTSGTGKTYIDGWNDGGTNQYDIVIGNQGSRVQCGTDSTSIASAQLAINSTTRGFLPPRMSTTQRDAIVSVVAGLVVYNASTNKLQCYNGSTWNDLF